MTRNALRNRRVLVVLSVAVAFAVITGVAVGSAVAAEGSRMSVDGVSFSRQEIDIAMERAARDGDGPGDLTGALDVLRDDLALFSLAREVAASDVVRPADILDLVDEVNRERSAVHQAGGVLYGPVEYDTRSFYGKSLTDIRQAVLKQLRSAPGPQRVTEADVRARFELDADQWSEAATTYHLTKAILLPSGDPSADASRAKSLTGADWIAVTEEAAIEAVDVSAEELAQGLLSPDTTALITTSADGAVIGPESSRDYWIFYRIDGRSMDTERAYEHYKTRIESVLYEELLDSRLETLRSAQTVHTP